MAGGTSPGSIGAFTRPNNVTFDHLRIAIRNFGRQARNWTASINSTDLSNPLTVRALNDQLMQLEKIFLVPGGVPLQNSTRHAILAYTGLDKYGQATFPGIVNLLNQFLRIPEQDRDAWAGWELLRRHVTEIYVMIVQAESHLKPHFII